MILSPSSGHFWDVDEVNKLLETFIKVNGSGPLTLDEIQEIVEWCDKQETDIILNASMETFRRELFAEVGSSYSIWFRDAKTAMYFKTRWGMCVSYNF